MRRTLQPLQLESSCQPACFFESDETLSNSVTRALQFMQPSAGRGGLAGQKPFMTLRKGSEGGEGVVDRDLRLGDSFPGVGLDMIPTRVHGQTPIRSRGCWRSRCAHGVGGDLSSSASRPATT